MVVGGREPRSVAEVVAVARAGERVDVDPHVAVDDVTVDAAVLTLLDAAAGYVTRR
ncbi:MAG: hypothetical protein QOG43_2716 [Actinomycetota bacterium]|jgi:hypothetical protein|nr:hypothetical protein [Actinomycetota bacterium]